MYSLTEHQSMEDRTKPKTKQISKIEPYSATIHYRRWKFILY
jgi:hypothetical protein